MKRLSRPHAWISLLPDTVRNEVRSAMTIKTYHHNEFLHHEGEPATAIYEIRSGIVKATTTAQDGKTILLTVWGKDDCAGESSTVDGGSRICDYQAVGTAQVAIVTKKKFDQLRNKHPEINKYLLYFVCLQFRLAANKHISAEILSFREKLITAILSVCVIDDTDYSATLEISQSDLSDLIASARQTVNKELNFLQSNNLIKVERERIYIPDIQLLEKQLNRPFLFPDITIDL